MIRSTLLTINLARAVAGVDLVARAPAVPAPIVRQVEDPLRCRCPECLALDAQFPTEGYQLALFPYQIQRRPNV